MKVSAIMPTFNQAEFIEEAIMSVVDQVDELIVVDDGSTDRTASLVRSCFTEGISLIQHNKTFATAAAINTGFEQTRFDLVTWVSSDNIHTPDWREKLEAQFTDNVGAVYSGYRYGLGGIRVSAVPYNPKRLIAEQDCYFGPSFLIRREVWEKAGDHRGRLSHDYDHWLRVEEACWDMGLSIIGISDPLCDYRTHDQRASLVRRHQYDAPIFQSEAERRRSAE